MSAGTRTPVPDAAIAGRRVTRVVADLVAFALPSRCAGCGGAALPERALCAACERRIPPVGTPLCVRCLAGERAPHGCHRHPAHRAWAAWVYDERAAVVVHALKFEGRTRLAARLGETIARALPPGYRPDVVAEVPLHPARRRERGFDQAALLADAVSRMLGTPRVAALQRRRATRGQSRLSAAARRAEMGGAFALRDPRAWHGRRVLVVDDVLTTGATLDAALAPLAAAGAETTCAVLCWAS
ncbi:MAG: ComF family protein [Candidatus Eisenbacteria bacterium]